MATPNVRDVLRNPGRLCLNPSDLSTDYPHGGTALGVVSRIEWEPGAVYGDVTAQEWGGVTSKVMYYGEHPAIYGVLRTWDNDLYNLLFRNSAQGTRSGTSTPGNRYIKNNPASDTVRAGASVSGNVIVFSPLAPDHHPFLICYNAKPKLDQAWRGQLSLASEFAVAFAFALTPDGDGDVYIAGLRDDPEVTL